MHSFVNRSLPRWRSGYAIACRAIPFQFESGPWLYLYDSSMREFGGHSGGEIPVPIPNTEDKPASVPYCTEV